MDTGQNPEAVVVEEREPQPILSIRRNVEIVRLTEAQGERLKELWTSMHRRGAQPAGPPFVRYHTFGETETDLEVGVPVAEAEPGEGKSRPERYRAEPPPPPGTSDHTMGLGKPMRASAPGWKSTETRPTALPGRSTGGSTSAWNQTRQPGPRLRIGERSWCSRSSASTVSGTNAPASI